MESGAWNLALHDSIVDEIIRINNTTLTSKALLPWQLWKRSITRSNGKEERYTAKFLFRQSPIRHSDYMMTGH